MRYLALTVDNAVLADRIRRPTGGERPAMNLAVHRRVNDTLGEMGPKAQVTVVDTTNRGVIT